MLKTQGSACGKRETPCRLRVFGMENALVPARSAGLVQWLDPSTLNDSSSLWPAPLENNPVAEWK